MDDGTGLEAARSGGLADGGNSLPPQVDPARRLAHASLCVLVAGGDDAAAFARLVAGLVDAGVPMLQVRDKALPPAALGDRARAAVEIARRLRPERPPLVIVNDRVDVAVACGADGAHVGADDMPTRQARRALDGAALAPFRRLLGRTAHDLDEARRAVAEGADSIGVGPCFPSATKSFDTFATAPFLRGVAAEIVLPVFAIGGITPERIDELAALGIRRFAVAAAVTAAPDPPAAARTLLERISRHGAAAGGADAASLSVASTAAAISVSSLGR
jgi:thiamine-phosphate pyrophosphorylase